MENVEKDLKKKKGLRKSKNKTKIISVSACMAYRRIQAAERLHLNVSDVSSDCLILVTQGYEPNTGTSEPPTLLHKTSSVSSSFLCKKFFCRRCERETAEITSTFSIPFLACFD